MKQLGYKLNQILSSNVAESILINLGSNEDSLFSEFVLSELRQLEIDDENIKNVDEIYSNFVKEYKVKFKQQLPYCFLIGKNVRLYSQSNAPTKEIDENENEFISNTICQIVQLNVKTINNSLLSLLLYLVRVSQNWSSTNFKHFYILQLGTYLEKIQQSSNIVTTSENIEKRLNLQDRSVDSLIFFKRLLKQLGFVFMDPYGKNLIRFPSQILHQRLELIHKCLLFISGKHSKHFFRLIKYFNFINRFTIKFNFSIG
jgi:hypothetical protein